MLEVAVRAATLDETRGSAMAGPDFSNVRSLDAARRSATAGKLVRVLGFPSELGGVDVAENSLCITPEAATALSLVVGTRIRFTKEKRIDNVNVEPAYEGESFVPVSITCHTSHRGKQGSFTPAVVVWQPRVAARK